MTFSSMHNFGNSLASHRGQLSVKKNDGTLYGIVELSNTIVAKYDVDVSAVDIADVSLALQLVVSSEDDQLVSVFSPGKKAEGVGGD